MKLFIQIPCYNEATTLSQTVADLPKKIDGIDEIEIMIVDDGSTDGTADIAQSLGIQHIVRQGSNQGLAAAFSAGRDYALAHGADILVNTDADNQYYGPDIAKLIPPILENKADIVVGCRPIADHPEFSPVKKALQLCGSWALRKISGTTVRDAPSGFRAFSRTALERIFIHSRFSYCMETLIQAGTTGMRVESVDIRVNPKTRESRLFKSIPQYLRKTGGTMISMFLLYRPGMFFTVLSLPFWILSLLLGIRFIWLVYFTNNTVNVLNCIQGGGGRTYVPSLVLLLLSATFAIVFIMMGVLATLLGANRRLAEEQIYLLRKMER